jgi:predicted DNA-binding ribbon-helix-helix protein
MEFDDWNDQRNELATGAPGEGAAASRRCGESTLVNRNVFIHSKRTSLRLEPAMWDALAEISKREGKSLHEVCSSVASRRRSSSLTAAIRVFIMTYFRAAATEEGHANIGHGRLYETVSNGRAESGQQMSA